MTEFNIKSTHQGLFYAYELGNRVHIHIFCEAVSFCIDLNGLKYSYRILINIWSQVIISI